MGEYFVTRRRGVRRGYGGLHRIRVALGVAYPDGEIVQPPGHQALRQDHIGLANFVVQRARQVVDPHDRRDRC